jgi:hypothetical protein
VLGFALAASVFRNTEAIAPIQYLDIQQIEMLDDLYQTPKQVPEMFSMLRYRSFHATAKFHPDFNQVPGLVRKLVEEAETSTAERLNLLKNKRQILSGENMTCTLLNLHRSPYGGERLLSKLQRVSYDHQNTYPNQQCPSPVRQSFL